MSAWDKHKKLVGVLVVFLLLLFLEWLFYLRVCSNEISDLDKTFKKNISKDIDTYANSNNASRVSDLLANFRQANEQLQQQLKDLNSRLVFHFPNPLLPEKFIPQSYVRQRLREERDYFAQQLATSQGIDLTAQARTLGMSLPDEVTEDIETDREWMRQILVMRRMCDLLLLLKSSDARVPVILSINTIRPLPSVNCGEPSNYVREYPVELEMDISLEGLSQFLLKSSDPQSMQVVRTLQIFSDPSARRSRHFNFRDIKTKKGRELYRHYYHVRVTCATAILLSEDKRKKASENASRKTTKVNRPAVPISH